MATDGAKSEVRYMGLLFCDIIAIGLSTWLLTIWMAEVIPQRTEKVKNARPDKGDVDSDFTANAPDASCAPDTIPANDANDLYRHAFLRLHRGRK